MCLQGILVNSNGLISTGQSVISRQNHGLIFRPIGQNLLTTASAYSLVYTIEIPPSIQIPQCDDQPVNPWICSILSPGEATQLQALRSSLNATQQGIESFLHAPLQEIDNVRTARALLGFIGKIIRTVFGTATVQDLARVTAIVNRVVDHVETSSNCFIPL